MLINSLLGQRMSTSYDFCFFFFSASPHFSSLPSSHPVFPHPFLLSPPSHHHFCLSLAVDYFWSGWLISVGSQAQCQGKWSAIKKTNRDIKKLLIFFQDPNWMLLWSFVSCVCVCTQACLGKLCNYALLQVEFWLQASIVLDMLCSTSTLVLTWY